MATSYGQRASHTIASSLILDNPPISASVPARQKKSSFIGSAPDAAFRSTLSPEAEFVLLSARTELSGARLQRWEKLLRTRGDCEKFQRPGDKTSDEEKTSEQASALDWRKVLVLASSHRVVGLLGQHLSARAWENVPASAVREFRNYFVRATVHSTALKTELARVCHQLESAGIPVVSFKGPTLGLAVYGNTVVRPSADLDLLVAREDVLRAKAILCQSGYAPEVELTPAQERIGLRVDSVFNLFRATPTHLETYFSSGFAVELHWAITSPCLPFDLDFSSVQAHLTWMDLPGVEADQSQVRALGAEDLLLILCVHGAKHLWERLIWLCDIAQLLQATPDLNWPAVLRAAGERGVERMTALGLVLTRDVLGTPLPREVENWLSTQPQALRLAAQLRVSLLRAESLNPNGQLAGHLFSADKLLLQTIDRPWHRLGFLWHLATTPTMNERASVALPESLDFLWCVLRPARAVQKRLVARAAASGS